MSEVIHPNPEQSRILKKKRRKKMLRAVLRAVLILFVIAALAAAGLFIYRKTNTTDAVNYQAYTASQGTISNALSFSGSLQLIDSATYTADADSQVRSIYTAEGETVTAGQKLMRLANGQIITAEFDGRVNQLPVSEGEEVAAGTSLIQVADFDHMTVSIRVDEYDISDVQVGQTARVTVTATEQTVDTVIDSINYISASSGNVAYYTATAHLDVPQGVYPGMQATISIPQSEAQDVVVLKLEGISFDEMNQAYVLMQGADGAMQPVYIETGVSNGNYVEIVSGLQSGDVVYAEAEAEEESGNLLGSLLGIGGGQMTPNNRQGGGAREMPGAAGTQRSNARQNSGMGGGNR